MKFQSFTVTLYMCAFQKICYSYSFFFFATQGVVHGGAKIGCKFLVITLLDSMTVNTDVIKSTRVNE